MGYSSLIDILGSMVVGGLLLLILLRMNEASTEHTYTYGSELQVQQNLVAVVKLLEADFRKIGYCVIPKKILSSQAIISADTSSISFYTDLPVSKNNMAGDGTVDILTYYLGSASELSQTPNPYDKKLYRVVGSETPKSANLGITQFRLRYFKDDGSELTCPVAVTGEIKTMQIDIKVENTAAYTKVYADTAHSQQYSSAFWRQIRLAARNLRNR